MAKQVTTRLILHITPGELRRLCDGATVEFYLQAAGPDGGSERVIIIPPKRGLKGRKLT